MNWETFLQSWFAIFAPFALGSILTALVYGKVYAARPRPDPEGETAQLKEEIRVLRMVHATNRESREWMRRQLDGLRDSVVAYCKLLGLKPGEPRPETLDKWKDHR